MSDPVSLVVPADERFRSLGPEVGGRYLVAAGGSEEDADVLVGELTEALSDVLAGAHDGDGVELDFRSPEGVVEVTLRCQGRSSVVTRSLPAAKP